MDKEKIITLFSIIALILLVGEMVYDFTGSHFLKPVSIASQIFFFSYLALYIWKQRVDVND